MGCNQSKSASAFAPQRAITRQHCGTQTSISFTNFNKHLTANKNRLRNHFLTDTIRIGNNSIWMHPKISYLLQSQNGTSHKGNGILVEGNLTNFSFSSITITSDDLKYYEKRPIKSLDESDNALTKTKNKEIGNNSDTLYLSMDLKFDTNEQIFETEDFDRIDEVQLIENDGFEVLSESESESSQSDDEARMDEVLHDTEYDTPIQSVKSKWRLRVVGSSIENGVVVYHIQKEDGKQSARLKKRYNDFKALYRSMEDFYPFRTAVPPLPSTGVIAYFYRNSRQTIHLHSHPVVEAFLGLE
uniref:AlNc14C124G6772 protein n=1 Tax=Albugo laibachii Nc14 TaxID=890382 RepID=F0WJP6_9STRA|nr:AlNc14C124G6772 [Albugo laibachii Nc14]|eukprot:CCA21497.1 AlNc14C124G6772 [Albugo laibachii Nc14]